MDDTAPIRGQTSRSLARAIFNADLPDQVVRELPAQTLYMVIKHNGLGSSAELIEMATVEQCRLLLDFDCWRKDQFDEENFFEWLSVTDETEGLTILQKILKAVDLKIIALLISRYIDTQIFDEPADLPPGPAYFTPDKGFTWIRILIEDENKNFLLGRFLALIFETKTDLFYQLISIPQVATPSTLEEESFQERNKRLLSEGIPEPEYAGQINAPYSRNQAQADLKSEKSHAIVEDVRAIEPLLYDSITVLNPLGALAREVPSREEFEAELTLILNAGIVFWAIDFDRYEEVVDFTSSIKGAINIGLEVAQSLSSHHLKDIHRILGLQNIYRLGLGELKGIRSIARNIPNEVAEAAVGESAIFSILAHARENFPLLPMFLREDGTFEEERGSLKKGSKPFNHVKEIELVRKLLTEKFSS